jgi:hypothetical protein
MMSLRRVHLEVEMARKKKSTFKTARKKGTRKKNQLAIAARKRARKKQEQDDFEKFVLHSVMY